MLTFITFCFLLLAQNISAQKLKKCIGQKTDEKTTIVRTSRSAIVSQGGPINANALYLPQPKYPEQARAKNLRGAVNVQVMIDEKGNVISAAAVSGNELFRNPAIQAAWKARFKKLLLDCKPKKYTGVIVYNFLPEKN